MQTPDTREAVGSNPTWATKLKGKPMNQGFRIEIQSDLTEEELSYARKFADWFIRVAKSPTSYADKQGGLSSHAFWRRGILGCPIGSAIGVVDKAWIGHFNDTNLVFRRHCRNRRVFAAVRTNTLERIDGSPLALDDCICAKHNGGQRVKYKTRPETEFYHEEGEISG